MRSKNNFNTYLILITIIIFIVSLPFLLMDYQSRMRTYNNHVCVNVYGLNEKCEKKIFTKELRKWTYSV